MSDNQVIPEAAVEAAAAYVHEHFHGSPLYVYKEGYQQDYKDTIRHALELAAPIMLAEIRSHVADQILAANNTEGFTEFAAGWVAALKNVHERLTK